MRHDWTRKFGSFLVVGGIATIVQYVVLMILVEYFSVNPVAASATGFAIGAVANYLLNYRFTFRSTASHHQTFPKFAITAFAGLLINTASMALLVDGLSVYYLLAQIVATGITLIWNFTVNALWSFRE